MYIYTDKAVTLCSLSIHIHLQLFLSSRLPEYQLHFQIEFLKLLFTVFQASQRCFTKKTSCKPNHDTIAEIKV